MKSKKQGETPIVALDTVSTGHLITTAARVILRRYESRQRSLGVTPPRSGILGLLHMVGPLSQKEIAAHLFLEKTNLSTLIREMARDNLVSIETSPADRRVNVVCIAPAGKKLLPAIRQINQDISRELEERLPEKSQKILRTFFADLLVDEFTGNPD